tara:strand:- start:215 stop:397 length:183 start_codon:yes stop_codon:yes gene_type:complete
MPKYKCEPCNHSKNLHKTTMIIVKGKTQIKEALCDKCNKYMKLDKKFDGFPTIIRNEPNL